LFLICVFGFVCEPTKTRCFFFSRVLYTQRTSTRFYSHTIAFFVGSFFFGTHLFLVPICFLDGEYGEYSSKWRIRGKKKQNSTFVAYNPKAAHHLKVAFLWLRPFCDQAQNSTVSMSTHLFGGHVSAYARMKHKHQQTAQRAQKARSETAQKDVQIEHVVPSACAESDREHAEQHPINGFTQSTSHAVRSAETVAAYECKTDRRAHWSERFPDSAANVEDVMDLSYEINSKLAHMESYHNELREIVEKNRSCAVECQKLIDMHMTTQSENALSTLRRLEVRIHVLETKVQTENNARHILETQQTGDIDLSKARTYMEAMVATMWAERAAAAENASNQPLGVETQDTCMVMKTSLDEIQTTQGMLETTHAIQHRLFQIEQNLTELSDRKVGDEFHRYAQMAITTVRNDNARDLEQLERKMVTNIQIPLETKVQELIEVFQKFRTTAEKSANELLEKLSADVTRSLNKTQDTILNATKSFRATATRDQILFKEDQQTEHKIEAGEQVVLFGPLREHANGDAIINVRRLFENGEIEDYVATHFEVATQTFYFTDFEL
jgi:hypothetical protein